MNDMIDVYTRWCIRNNKPIVSADEQEDLTPCQQAWIDGFIALKLDIPDRVTTWRQVLRARIDKIKAWNEARRAKI